MKRLFNDFDINTNSNGSFHLVLDEKGKLQYQLTDVEEESNAIYLTHKDTGIEVEVTSKGDANILKELDDGYKKCKYDINLFKEKFNEEE